MPSTAAQTFTIGLVHREATRVAALLRDPEVTSIHVVATPEEMPVTEALEIVARLRTDLGLPLGRIFLNRCRQTPPTGAGALVARLAGAAGPAGATLDGVPAETLIEGLRLAATRALAWDPIQRRSHARLASGTQAEVVTLPLLVAEEFGIHEVEQLATFVAAGGGEG